jgi:ElaB/YqjD/DUF883 family membrane-anchored ribosome-binding protein
LAGASGAATERKGGSVATEQAQERRETAGGAGGKAEEVVSQAKEQVQQKAGEVKGSAMEQVRDQLDSQSTRLGEQLTPFAEALRETGTHLEVDGQTSGAKAAQGAADQAERLARYLKESDSDRILGDVEDFARRRPWMAGAIGFATGFVAARFLKASAARRDGNGRSGYETRTRQPYLPPDSAFPEAGTRWTQGQVGAAAGAPRSEPESF